MHDLLRYLDDLDANDYAEDNFFLLTIVEARTDGHDQLTIELALTIDGNPDSRWRVVVDHTLESRIGLAGHWWATVTADHPLLADLVDRREQLYFRGPVSSPNALIGDLSIAHRAIMGDWRPAATYMNAALWNTSLLATTGGVLATGPSRLLAEYEHVLEEHAAMGNRVDLGPPVALSNTEEWRPLPWAPQLVLFDRSSVGTGTRHEPCSASYAIGKRVQFERL